MSTTESAFVLWRPSFAGTWRDIGEFSSRAAADRYATSAECQQAHGSFNEWEVRGKEEGPPEPFMSYVPASSLPIGHPDSPWSKCVNGIFMMNCDPHRLVAISTRR